MDVAAADRYEIRDVRASKRSKLVAFVLTVVDVFSGAGGTSVFGVSGIDVVDRASGAVVLHIDDDESVGPGAGMTPGPTGVRGLLADDLRALTASEFAERWGIETDATQA